MKRPQVYFVDGNAVAVNGIHVFKEVVSGCGSDIGELQKITDVTILKTDTEGIYYLQNEGLGADEARKYLMASGNVVATGIGDCDGSISSILSPFSAYRYYVEDINGILTLLNKTFCSTDEEDIVLRLLFIGVCGELEGYLYTALISLIQGSRDAFNIIRNCRGLPTNYCDEEQLRAEIVKIICDKFQFQHIRKPDSKEREIYETLIGESINVTKELSDNIVWRNKLAHKVPFYEKTIYPTKDDVLNFIHETNKVVDFIDTKIAEFKSEWFSDF